jgi:hypothetical protein
MKITYTPDELPVLATRLGLSAQATEAQVIAALSGTDAKPPASPSSTRKHSAPTRAAPVEASDGYDPSWLSLSERRALGL